MMTRNLAFRKQALQAQNQTSKLQTCTVCLFADEAARWLTLHLCLQVGGHLWEALHWPIRLHGTQHNCLIPLP